MWESQGGGKMDEIRLTYIEYQPSDSAYYCTLESRTTTLRYKVGSYQLGQILTTGILNVCLFGSGQIEIKIEFSDKARKRFQDFHKEVQGFKGIVARFGNHISVSRRIIDEDCTVELPDYTL